MCILFPGNQSIGLNLKSIDLSKQVTYVLTYTHILYLKLGDTIYAPLSSTRAVSRVVVNPGSRSIKRQPSAPVAPEVEPGRDLPLIGESIGLERSELLFSSYPFLSQRFLLANSSMKAAKPLGVNSSRGWRQL